MKAKNTRYKKILVFSAFTLDFCGFVVLFWWEVVVLKPLKKKVSITLDEDIIEKVKILAEDCDRSFSQYVNLVLKRYLSEKHPREKSL